MPPGYLLEEGGAESVESPLTRRVSFTLHSELQRKFKALSGAPRRRQRRAARRVPTVALTRAWRQATENT